jgi:hypothetical protein
MISGDKDCTQRNRSSKKSKRRRKAMKKTICLVGIGILLVSMVLMGCAPVKTTITKSNLSALKGTWEGWTTFSSVQTNPILTTLQITNDTVPVQGRITLNNLPRGVAVLFPADAVTAGGNVTIDFKNGLISDQGTLIGQTGQNFLEFTLLAGEKMKMNGWFYYNGTKGTVDLTKK